MAEKDEIIKNTIDASKYNVPIEGFFMKEKRYGLTPLEHKILSESETRLGEWSKRFFLISIGLGLTIISKVIWFLIKFNSANKEEKQVMEIGVEIWEWIYLGIGIGFSLIFYFLSCTKLDDSERKKVMEKIKVYFDGE